MLPTNLNGRDDHKETTLALHTHHNEYPHSTRWNSLQAAIDALPASGGVLFVPAGAYSISDTVLLRSNVNIIGAGKNATLITYTGTGAAFANKTPGTRIFRTRLADMTVITSTGAIGLDLQDVTSGVFDNLTLAGFETGVKLSGSQVGYSVYNRFMNVDCSGGKCGFLSAAAKSNENTFHACRAIMCQDYGFRVENSNHNVLMACAIESCGVGFSVTGGLSFHNHAISCRFEGNTTGVEQVNGASGTVSLIPHYGSNGTDEIGLAS